MSRAAFRARSRCWVTAISVSTDASSGSSGPLKPGDRQVERARLVAVDIARAVAAQEQQKHLAPFDLLRSGAVSVDAEILVGQEQRVAGIDPLECPHRLEPVLQGNIHLLAAADDLRLEDIQQPDRDDQLGAGDGVFQVEQALLGGVAPRTSEGSLAAGGATNLSGAAGLGVGGTWASGPAVASRIGRAGE